MCTVQIYDAERRFVNEIPVRTTLEGVQYADDLAIGKPGKDLCCTGLTPQQGLLEVNVYAV